MSGAMGSHQSARAETTTWLTPPELIEKLGPFDLDPCAAPSPRPWPTAQRHIELPEDGLAAEWDGHVWLNPPYSFAAWTWLDKLASHGDGIALLPRRRAAVRSGARAVRSMCLIAYGPRAAERLMTADIAGTYVPLRSGEREP